MGSCLRWMMFRIAGACWRVCPALSLRDDGWGTCMSVRLPAARSWFSICLTDEDRTVGQEYEKHLHEITLGTTGTAIWERQAQLVSQCPCLLLLVGFVYPVLVGFVCISGCSRHVGMDRDSNLKLFVSNIPCEILLFLFRAASKLMGNRQNMMACLPQKLTPDILQHKSPGLPSLYTVADGPGPRVREQKRAPCQTFRRGNPMTCKVVLHATAVLQG